MASKIFKLAALMLLFSLICSSSMAKCSKSGKLKVGFYAKTCPPAEIIVRAAVYKAVSKDRRIAAALIRMHYHDCFVRGCDGSVLLDSVPGKPAAEKEHRAHFGLRGFEVIDEAKALIEALCPGTVSCADILAFAARDSAFKVGNIEYDVQSGRRDGRVSFSSSEVGQNLPAPFLTASELRDNFTIKGLSLDDMVTLSGAHSIGASHCSFFSNRLFAFNATFKQDPSLDPGYAAFLKHRCSAASKNNDPIVDNDLHTPTRLDNKYYVNLKNHEGLLISDQTLFDSSLTRKLVVYNAKHGAIWAKKFAAAMVRMGNIDVLTGKQGEIRRNCRFVN